MDCSPNEEAATHSPPPYTVVTTADCFDKMREALLLAPRFAIDVEADSLYHYFEKVCLIQISTDAATYVLDPLAVSEIAGLAPLFSNPSVEKVFHAASYDVRCLRRDFGFVFAHIFDTHVAAQFLGYEFLGLSNLMEVILGVHHSKRRQRDDWSRRPLIAEQLEYAAMDTHHLLRLRDALEADLRAKGRLSWAQEEFAAEAVAERREKEFDAEGFRRIKGSRELSLQDQVALRALYVFRDEIARKMDVPPFKVMNNSTLIDLVLRPPLTAESMFKRRGISNRIARKHAGSIIKLIAEARQQDHSILEPPARNNWKSPGRSARFRLEELKRWRNEKAKELGLHVGVVFPAYLLETLAATPPADLDAFASLPDMSRWRAREFGEELLQLLCKQESQPDSPGES